MVNSLLRHLSFRLLPGRCLLCLGDTNTCEDICAPCKSELPWLGHHCLRCALPLAHDAVCGQCLQSPPRFDDCVAAWEYTYPLDQLISRFKYQGRWLEGNLLAELALPRLRAQIQPDLIVAVPMHWQRRLKRGFNQADIIARHWASALNIPMLHGLYRQHANPPQQGLSARQRHRNLQSAFALHADALVADKHIALVDDVVTTAATANNLAAILRKAGAERISVWCLARTP